MCALSTSEPSQGRRIPPAAAAVQDHTPRASHSVANPTISVIAALVAALLLFVAPASAEKAKDLRPQGYVNDFASVLSPEARERLTALCQEVDQKAQAQIAVVTIRTLEGEPIEDFSVDLATRWGIGPKQKDRGVLILLAVDDHHYRVEVGYGLEGILPDGKVGGFGREMVPQLRRDDYDKAMVLLTARIAQVIAQDRGVTLTSPGAEVSPGESERSTSGNPSQAWPVLVTLFAAFFVIRIFLLSMGGRRGRRRSFWMGGPWVGGGWGGGSWGGGSWGGGGGFGGFGGGSFGGGGASGSW
jgi:uncharacterized protein